MFIGIFLNALLLSSCDGPKRTKTIQKLFSELDRVSDKKAITEEMLSSYIEKMPWYGRWSYNTFIRPKGGPDWVVRRCSAGANVITEETALASVETCLSKCLYVTIVDKCLRWGYADYY